MENFYVVGNNLTPFNYNFHPLLLNADLSDDDFVKLCENIQTYLKVQPEYLSNSSLGTLYLGDLPLRTTYKNCFNTDIQDKKPFFIWGNCTKSAFRGGTDSNLTTSRGIDRDRNLVNRFKSLDNSLFIEEDHNLSNPFILSEIIHTYFRKLLEEARSVGSADFISNRDKLKSEDLYNPLNINASKVTIYKYDFNRKTRFLHTLC